MWWGFIFPVQIPHAWGGVFSPRCRLLPTVHPVSPCSSLLCLCPSFPLPCGLFSTCSCGQSVLPVFRRFSGLFTRICYLGVSMGWRMLRVLLLCFPQKSKIFFKTYQTSCFLVNSFLAAQLRLDTILCNFICILTHCGSGLYQKSPETFSVEKRCILDPELPYRPTAWPSLSSLWEKDRFVVGSWNDLQCASMNYLWRVSRRTLTAGQTGDFSWWIHKSLNGFPWVRLFLLRPYHPSVNTQGVWDVM